MRPSTRRALAGLMAVGAVLVSVGLEAGQLAPALGAAAEPTISVPITDHDLARIRKALDGSPALKIDDSSLRYYVEILARRRTFAEYVKGYDLMNGPTRSGNPMTHKEFVGRVTDREFYSSGGITATEILQFELTNWLAQTLVKKAIEDLQSARSEAEIDEIRARIDRDLGALKRDGGK